LATYPLLNPLSLRDIPLLGGMRLHFVPPVPPVVRIALSSGTAADAAIAASPLHKLF